jgi:hypothetical protein
MRRYRRNADEHRRRLERAAAQGDPHARAELFIQDLRAGKPVEQIAAEIVSTLGVRELQALESSLASDLRNSLIIATHTRPWVDRGRAGARMGEMGGWFPEHQRQDVCPRGHSEEGVGFHYNESNIVYRDVFDADADSVTVGGIAQSPEGSDEEWLSCEACYASWPSTGVGYG